PRVDHEHSLDLDIGRDFREVIDAGVEELFAGQLAQPLFNFIDVLREHDAEQAADPRSHHAEQQAIAQEDLENAAVGSAQRLEDADVAGFLGHDHAENRQDAEPRHGDDEKQEYVEDAFFNVDGGQQGALLAFPGID